MEARELALHCRELADGKKAENIVILDVREVSSITDYFVIATGTSEPHLRAIVDAIRDTLEEDHGLSPRATDGKLETSWVVLDYFDVIVHIMRADIREHYDLESLWSDAPRLRQRRKPAARKQAAAKR
ncbi:MAG: ribosome silencing factor [Verrucomicrobiota bacterium]